MRIINMNDLNQMQINQAAKILTESLPLGYSTVHDAFEEINEQIGRAHV